MVECESGNQRIEHHRIRPSCMHCMFSIVLLLTILVSVGSPYLTWAAVYECLDVAGNPMLTNRPAQPQICRMLIEGTATDLTLSEVRPPPEVSPPLISSDKPSPPSYIPPMPPNLPTDIQGASIDSLPVPNPQASSSLSPSPPCAHELNLLKPLRTPPCVRPDQSGAQSQPEAAPAP